MTDLYFAILLTFFHHGVGLDTIPTSSESQCEQVVSEWKKQPSIDLNPLLSNMRFSGYCRRITIDGELPHVKE